MIHRVICIILTFMVCENIFSQAIPVNTRFDPLNLPPRPDYSLVSNWAALPFIKDRADTVPGKGQLKNKQDQALADVFFIHPTSLTGTDNGIFKWNGDIGDPGINKQTDEGSITYQASVFNEAGKIYAPRYRQAHYSSYLTPDTASARQAFDLAYSDVKSAFEYYLKNYNKDRPIIISSHSQGTTHAKRLMKEYFDNKLLNQQLVCAYLIGMPVYDSIYEVLKPCKNAIETGCYCTWQTFAKDYFPENYVKPKTYTVCTNPLTWGIDDQAASAKLNKGGTLRDLRKIIPHLCDARVGDGVLRISKPNIPGRAFLNIKNYHVGDYNLFYLNIRENAVNRVNAFVSQGNRK